MNKVQEVEIRKGGISEYLTPDPQTQIKFKIKREASKIEGTVLEETLAYNKLNSVVNKLIYSSSDNITEFYGGPLYVDEDLKDWVSLVIIKDENGSQPFHVIYTNMRPEDRKVGQEATILEFDELQFKLADGNDKNIRRIVKLLSSKKMSIYLHPCNVCMSYYPNLYISDKNSSKYLENRIKKVLSFLKLSPVYSVIDMNIKNHLYVEEKIVNGIELLSTQEFKYNKKTLKVYNFFIENDPWKYYQIITNLPLKSFEKRKVLNVRLDSGCDIGQIYLDKGCECREQLHRSIINAFKKESIIVHIPGQDGRGVGFVTKMETEGIKRGIKVRTNINDTRGFDTITSAKYLLGDNFDYRTFDGTGKLLLSLGVKRIVLNTSNKMKLNGLRESGLSVELGNPIIVNKKTCQTHLKSKYKYSDIYIKP